MQTGNSGSTGANFLTEVRAMFRRGERDDAFQLLNMHLEVEPGDAEARLVKAELCLEARLDPVFVGKVADAYRQQTGRNSQQQAVVDRTQEWGREALDQGRNMLVAPNVNLNEALRVLNMSTQAMPWAAEVWLSKGLALLDYFDRRNRPPAANQPPGRPSPFGGSLLRRTSPPGRPGGALPGRPGTVPRPGVMERTLEDALRRARDLAGAGAVIWKTATLKLARWSGDRNQHEQALNLLREALAAGLDVAEQMAPLERRMAEGSLQVALDWAMQLLRLGQVERARKLLREALKVAPDRQSVHVLMGEAWLLAENHRQAAKVFAQALELGEDAVALNLEETARLSARANKAGVKCPQCDTALAVKATMCGNCRRAVPNDVLLREKFKLGDLPAHLLSRVGLAEALALLDRPGEALDALEDCELASAHPSTVLVQSRQVSFREAQRAQEYRLQLEAAIADVEAGHLTEAQAQLGELADAYGGEQGQLALAWQALAVADSDTLANKLESASLVRRARGIPGEVWVTISRTRRHALVRALLDANLLLEARDLLATIYIEEERAYKVVQALETRTHNLLVERCDRLAAEAEAALAAGSVERALRLSAEALEILPEHAASLMARAGAHLAAEAPYQAALHYQAVLAAGPQSELALRAQVGVARAHEMLGNLDEAGRVLGDLTDDRDLSEFRGRLKRRQTTTPVVVVRQQTSAVTGDSLRRVAVAGPQYTGVFAISIQAAARWRENESLSVPRAAIARAGHDFVATLGGLADTVGNPAFELRLVAHPDPEAPTRGKLDVAILCKVTHPHPEIVEELALGLWQMLRVRLPLAEHGLYEYEPVYSQSELEALLEPFTVAGAAEFMRREASDAEHYTVYPFTTGGTTLQNLAWILLRQQQAAMVSVYLQPSAMLPWEEATLSRRDKRNGHGNSNGNGYYPPAEMPQPGIRPADVDMIPQAQRTLKTAYLTDELRHMLAQRAFVMRVSVASAQAGDPLLAHAVAAEVFGPQGAYQVVQAATQAELDAACRNLALLDVERWTDTQADTALGRLQVLVTGVEAALTFRLPMPDVEGIPGVAQIEVKTAPPVRVPPDGVRLGESVTTIAGTRTTIRTRLADRRRHMYVVGKTGVGKSTLLEYMALQDIEAGLGVAVLDPHGDLVESIMTRIPPERADDVIIFDPSDEERPIGLNILHARNDTERHRIATEFVEMLVRMYDPYNQGFAGPVFQHTVRMGLLTAMLGKEDATLLEVIRVLTNVQFAKQLLVNVQDPLVRNFWEEEVSGWNDRYFGEMRTYVVSKFNRFVGDKRMRHIIGQSEAVLDFRAIMDRKKILLVNLSKGKVGPESAQFLGFLLLQSLLVAALSRADSDVATRDDFFIYVDEFQNFATDSFGAMLSEGRKYGLCLVMANQYIEQLPHNLKQAVFGNVGSLVAFRTGVGDAALLAQEFYPVFKPDDLVNLPRYTAAVRLLLDGLAERPFAMRTRLSERLPDLTVAERVREMSRQRYGRDVRVVEREVGERYALVKPTGR